MRLNALYLKDIMLLCPQPDVPMGVQLVEQGFATQGADGYLHCDEPKMRAAIAAAKEQAAAQETEQC